MHKVQKPKEVLAIKERFQTAKGLIFAENRGLKVSEVSGLRKILGKEKAFIKVVKNRLVKRALREAKIEGLDPFFVGPMTMTSSDVDAISPAKILVNFIKENERLVIKGGYCDGVILKPDQVKALAMLPSKEELYSQVLRCLQGPATQLVNVLTAIPRELVTALEAIKKQKVPST